MLNTDFDSLSVFYPHPGEVGPVLVLEYLSKILRNGSRISGHVLIWVVMSQSAGHKVLAALNDPLDGEPRVEKTYAKTTPPQQFRIDTPGMTAIYPAEYVRDTLFE